MDPQLLKQQRIVFWTQHIFTKVQLRCKGGRAKAKQAWRNYNKSNLFLNKMLCNLPRNCKKLTKRTKLLKLIKLFLFFSLQLTKKEVLKSQWASLVQSAFQMNLIITKRVKSKSLNHHNKSNQPKRFKSYQECPKEMKQETRLSNKSCKSAQ